MTNRLEKPHVVVARPGHPTPIGRNALLTALPAAELALLAPHFSDIVIPPGFRLHEAGETIEHVYFPHAGLVSLLVPTLEGHAVEVAAIGRDGAIGAGAGLGSPVALSRAVVQLPVTAARMRAERLADIARMSPAVAGLLLRCGDALTMQVQQIAACNAVHDVQARLSRWLLHADDRWSGALPVTQEQLSQLLGVQRTTITLVCRTLQLENIIHIGRGMIEIRDAGALRRKACSCYQVLREARQRAAS